MSVQSRNKNFKSAVSSKPQRGGNGPPGEKDRMVAGTSGQGYGTNGEATSMAQKERAGKARLVQ